MASPGESGQNNVLYVIFPLIFQKPLSTQVKTVEYKIKPMTFLKIWCVLELSLLSTYFIKKNKV